jgi:hypothetical protein
VVRSVDHARRPAAALCPVRSDWHPVPARSLGAGPLFGAVHDRLVRPVSASGLSWRSPAVSGISAVLMQSSARP